MKSFSIVLSSVLVSLALTACGGGFDFTVEDKTPKNPKPTPPVVDPKPPVVVVDPPKPTPPPAPGTPVHIFCQLSLAFIPIPTLFEGAPFLFNGNASLKAPLAASITEVQNSCIKQASHEGQNSSFCYAISPEKFIFGTQINLGSGHNFFCSLENN